MPNYRVAIAGHSQLPRELEVTHAQVEIFRKPGALVRDFFDRETLGKIFEKNYDVVVLWIGSNDVKENTSVRELVLQIINLIVEVQHSCGAQVIFICLEDRRYGEGNRFIPPRRYRTVRDAINKRVRHWARSQPEVQVPGWSSNTFELASDGVHFTTETKERIKRVLRHFINLRLTDNQV